MRQLTGKLVNILFGLLVLAGGEVPTEFEEDSFDLRVRLVNEDTESVHIFGPSEGFDGSNRLRGGASRMHTIESLPTNEYYQIVFTAGRNGVVLVRVTCASFGPPFQTPSVTYWGGTELICETW